MNEYETCDVCGKQLSINNSEDFFVEDTEGSHVFCEKHWLDYSNQEKQKALDLINTMEIEFWDTDIVDGEVIVYTVTVKDNEFNRDVIKKLGYTDSKIDCFKSYRTGEIELQNFVWDYANWFDGNDFSL